MLTIKVENKLDIMTKLEYKLPSPLKMGGTTSSGAAGMYSNPKNIRGNEDLPFIAVAGAGAPPDFSNFTSFCNDVYVREQHLTVIRRGPTMPPSLEFYSWDAYDVIAVLEFKIYHEMII